MSVELGTLLPSTTFSESPTISNPPLYSTNNTLLGTTALAKTAITGTNKLTTNTVQTMTGNLTFNNPPTIATIDRAGVIQIGANTDVVNLGGTSTSLSLNGISVQASTNLAKYFCQGSTSTTGGSAGLVTAQKLTGGIADLTTVTTLPVTITAGLYVSAPVVILTPTSTVASPATPPAYATYWVSGVSATGFTVNSTASGRRFYYLTIGT